jgi:hypothetical protein
MLALSYPNYTSYALLESGTGRRHQRSMYILILIHHDDYTVRFSSHLMSRCLTYTHTHGYKNYEITKHYLKVRKIVLLLLPHFSPYNTRPCDPPSSSCHPCPKIYDTVYAVLPHPSYLPSPVVSNSTQCNNQHPQHNAQKDNRAKTTYNSEDRKWWGYLSAQTSPSPSTSASIHVPYTCSGGHTTPAAASATPSLSVPDSADLSRLCLVLLLHHPLSL